MISDKLSPSKVIRLASVKQFTTYRSVVGMACAKDNDGIATMFGRICLPNTPFDRLGHIFIVVQ